ncbi:hypothetical protein V4C53_10235 [Paraburkholderia azotifigens]
MFPLFQEFVTKAFVFSPASLPIDDPQAFVEVDLRKSLPGPCDLL